MKFRNSKNWWWGSLTLIVAIGFYNALVINVDSQLSYEPSSHIQEMEEMEGVIHPTRTLAAGKVWKKITPEEMTLTQKPIQLATAEIENKNTEAAIKDDLSLELVEVSNPKLWKEGLTKNDFEGNLETKDGVIDFSVSLPSDEEISVSFMEMNGNVFKYDYKGEVYQAMIFQADQQSYMVNLTDGPLEGTRFRFNSAPSEEQQAIQQELAENHQVEVGTFGQEQAQEAPVAEIIPSEQDPDVQLQVHAFNLDPQVL